jgi:hypothetical protein
MDLLSISSLVPQINSQYTILAHPPPTGQHMPRHLSSSAYIQYLDRGLYFPNLSSLYLIPSISPELMQFGQRDFSIYALDPSESDAAPNTMVVSSSSGSSQPTAPSQPPPGVAVGMGLMSWALAAPDDSALVTGIINKTASGESALEVVFALRGVRLFTPSCLTAVRWLILLLQTLHAQQPPAFQHAANPWQPQIPVSAPMHMPPGV